MNEWNMLIINVSLVSMLYFIIIYKNRKELFSFFVVYTIFYWLVMYFGIYIYFILYIYFDFDLLNIKYIKLSVLYSIISYSIFFITYKLFTSKLKIRIFPKISYLELRLLGYILLITSLFAIFIYILMNGGLILLQSDSYENRFSSNLGLGALTLLFPLFLLAFSILFLTKPSLKNWRKYFLHGTLVAFLIYLAIGGGRLMIALHVFIFLIMGYHYKYIKLKTISIGVIILIPFVAILAIIRAGKDFESIPFQMLMFTTNSFSPFDSFVRILQHYDYSGHFFEGLSVIYNQFLALVPRFLWDDKPILVLNTGNFYTINILEYDKMVTISPTINGSMYIVNGLYGLLIGSFIIAIILKILDNSFYKNPFLLKYFDKNLSLIKRKNNKLLKRNVSTSLLHLIFYYYILLNTYILVRESLEVYLLTRILIPFIIIIFFLLIAKLIAKIIKR